MDLAHRPVAPRADQRKLALGLLSMALVFSWLPACVTTDVMQLDTAPRQQTSAANVELMLQWPDRGFRQIAVIEASDSELWNASWNKLSEHLRSEAAKLGANAVVVGQRETVEGAGIMPVGNSWYGYTTEQRHLVGVAIVWDDRSPTPPDLPGGRSGGEASATERRSSGSGVVVSSDGVILTNRHVVDGCAQLKVGHGQTVVSATVVATDDEVDLALIRTERPIGSAVAVFRAEPQVSLGERVFAVGYPLRGILADGPNATSGSISALAGPSNDRSLLQTTAPLQPGNSGGPLVDGSGQVVGIVVSALDIDYTLRAAGTLPQNVNFAINDQEALAFLGQVGLEPNLGSGHRSLDGPSVVRAATGYTVLIECLSGTRW